MGIFPKEKAEIIQKNFLIKKSFLKDLMIFLNENFSPDDNIIILGDLNISPEDIDIGIGENNRKRWLSNWKMQFFA